MDHNKCINYLRDLGLLIKEKALEAKETKEATINRADEDFNIGRLMAFHEVVSLMQQQAEAFGIPFDEIGLADIDPEKNLL